MNDKNHNHHHHSEIGSTVGQNILMCSVMKGIPVDKQESETNGWVRVYKGKKYYFCCDSCVVDFDASPESYANNLQMS